jgi:hypothetical protein
MSFSRLLSSNARLSRARGVTFVELCIGMTITALVMAAVASFTLAMGSAWRHNKGGMTGDGSSNLLNAKLNAIMREARCVGAVRNGSLTDASAPAAVVLFWLHDSNGDRRAQVSEIAAFDYDASSKSLRFYQRPAPQLDLTLTNEQFMSGGGIDILRNRPGATPVLQNVTACRIDTYAGADASDRPRVAFTLKCNIAGQERTLMAVSSLRAPSAEPK